MTAMHRGQRCTPASLASHAMYERTDPFFERVAGGVLDMTHCRYEQSDEKTTRVTGFAFRRDAVYRVKLEGAGRVGERAISIAGIHDPYTIRHIEQVMAWARGKVEETWGPQGERYRLFYHVYGRDGVMGPWEPQRAITSQELYLVVEAVADRWEDVDHITFDILFPDRQSYDLVRRSGRITRESIAALYRIPPDRITTFAEYDPGLAIKFTIRRERPSGSPGERDVFGSQQYPPLFQIAIPVPEA